MKLPIAKWHRLQPVRVLISMAAALALLLPLHAAQPLVLQVDLEGMVHPLTAEYVEQGLARAAAQHADAVILRLSTPGGLDTSMRAIIEKILASPVPVIAWVGPSGSRAASAGFLILESADVAAMASGTNAGAAHPVLMGEKMDEVMKQKVEQDAAAYLRSIAGKRGRNPELAEKAVLESRSFTETEALKNQLIELIADSPQDLAAKLDGKTIKRFDGHEVTLRLAGANIVDYSGSARYEFLRHIIDPNIAFILLALGALGLYVEFTHPGLVVPGVAGAIMLVLGMFALSLLPINWAGALLIVLAFLFFVLEAKFMTHGVLAAGGIAAMVIGALILVNSPVPEMRVKLATALAVAIPLGVITTILVRLAIKAWKGKVTTGDAGLLDEVGTAQTDLAPEGKIFVHGEIWNAVSKTPVPRGARVRVRAIEGLHLTVEPDTGGPAPAAQADRARPQV
jgi:membrane-bound serine protease (ClpP class)